MDLKQVFELVESSWRFDGGNYPALLEPMTAEQRKVFAVNHIVKHQMKSVGHLAALTEEIEHGLPMLDEHEAEEVARKMLFNSIRLLQILGVSAEDLAADLDDQASP